MRSLFGGADLECRIAGMLDYNAIWRRNCKPVEGKGPRIEEGLKASDSGKPNVRCDN